ncbi:MAG: ABC transporter permease [Planctomycetes bacterium]|nr:ABC transporter permease [Planctomycetota bacterium]MBI3845724.1 ABC transporter permease [Planctomycetota bacterium]
MNRLLRVVRLGLKSLALHKLRSLLTVLGIVFGVCSVIAMLSIGEGASYEAQEQIRALGSTNIIIRSVKPPESQSATAERSRVVEYGLTYEDAERIALSFPGVDVVVPVWELRKDIRFLDRRTDGRILGTVPWFAEMSQYPVSAGRFLTPQDLHERAPVCVVGAGIARDLFVFNDPIGAVLKLGSEYFKVIGVMAPKKISTTASGTIDYSSDVYLPLTTAREVFGGVTMKISSGSRDMERVELHQVQVRVADTGLVEPMAAALREMLERFHKKQDWDLLVPLELLRRAEATKRIFNIVLGSIAGISLLVGGIGIMNIMLASVTERTREIGIRRALGAKRRHIVTQFLVETVVLSVAGGLVGVVLGVVIPVLVTHFAEMRTIITPFSLILAFGISALVGMIFGIYPAWRAAGLDPIEALRHE